MRPEAPPHGRRSTPSARSALLRWVLRGGTGAAQASQVLATSVGVLLINLATGIVTARVLGATGRGELAAILVWVQVVGGMSTLGIPTAVTYNTRIREDDAKSLMSTGIALTAVAGAVGGVVGAFVVIPHALAGYPPVIVTGAQLAMIAAPFVAAGLAIIGALYARLQFGRANVVAILQPVTTLVTLLVLTAAGHLTPISAAIAYLAPWAFATIVLLHYVIRVVGITTRDARPATRRLLSYGARIYPLDVLGTIGQNVDQAVIAVVVGPTPLGIYVAASRAGGVLVVVQKALLPVLEARGAGRSVQAQVTMSGRAARPGLLLMLVLITPLFLLAPWLLGTVFGSQFAGGATVMRLLLFEQLLSSTTHILAIAFFNVGRPGIVSALEAVATALGAGLTALLTALYGIEGAATAVLISTSVRLALVLASFPLRLGVRPPSLLPRPEDFATLREAITRRRQHARPSE